MAGAGWAWRACSRSSKDSSLLRTSGWAVDGRAAPCARGTLAAARPIAQVGMIEKGAIPRPRDESVRGGGHRFSQIGWSYVVVVSYCTTL